VLSILLGAGIGLAARGLLSGDDTTGTSATPSQRARTEPFPSNSCRFDAPTGWTILWADLDRGAIVHNEARSPSDPLESVVCDVQLRPAASVAALARRRQARRSGFARYVQERFGPARVNGQAAWIWAYSRAAQGRTVRVEEVYFPGGTIVVTQAPEERYAALAPAFDAVVASYRRTQA
jgi:hypothetical protein